MEIIILDFPTQLSLSLSSICNAQCIWCPVGRRLNTSHKSIFMSLETVDKAISDSKGMPIDSIFLADMGEPLMNPNFKEIVRRCKAGHPGAKLYLSTNFYLMDNDMADFVVDNLDVVGLNIDGISEEGYFAVKHLPLKAVIDNLLRFIEKRKKNRKMINITTGGMSYAHIQISPLIFVSITSQARYYMEIGEPEKITVPDETNKTHEFLRKILQNGDDGINSSLISTWAERRRWNRPRSPENAICSNMHAIGRKCCIDTDGNIIVCCQDFDSECKFGNIMESDIRKIWNGAKRQHFLEMIVKNDYAGIGLPCSVCHD